MPITDEEDIENLSAQLSLLRLWTPEPLEEFHPFPRLPAELRRLIFKFSLPDSKRMITVTAHHRKLMPKKTSYVFFTATPYRPGLPSQSEDVRDIRMLRVCFESREVFLENNRGCIPGSSKSLIRFDQQHSTIFVENFHELIAYEGLREAYKSGLWKPNWLRSIHNIALGDISKWKAPSKELKFEIWMPFLQLCTSLRTMWLGNSNSRRYMPIHNPQSPDDWVTWRIHSSKLQLRVQHWWARLCPPHTLPVPQLLCYSIPHVGFGLYP